MMPGEDNWNTAILEALTCDEQCPQHPDSVCTREKGHTSIHMAHYGTGHQPKYIWDQSGFAVDPFSISYPYSADGYYQRLVDKSGRYIGPGKNAQAEKKTDVTHETKFNAASPGTAACLKVAPPDRTGRSLWHCSRAHGHEGPHMAHRSLGVGREPEYVWDNDGNFYKPELITYPYEKGYRLVFLNAVVPPSPPPAPPMPTTPAESTPTYRDAAVAMFQFACGLNPNLMTIAQQRKLREMFNKYRFLFKPDTIDERF